MPGLLTAGHNYISALTTCYGRNAVRIVEEIIEGIHVKIIALCPGQLLQCAIMYAFSISYANDFHTLGL